MRTLAYAEAEAITPTWGFFLRQPSLSRCRGTLVSPRPSCCLLAAIHSMGRLELARGADESRRPGAVRGG